MKRRKIIIIILFLMNFSVIHEYFFIAYDNEHLKVSEYVYELEHPTNHKDLCDAHFHYHMSYTLPQQNTITFNNLREQKQQFLPKYYDFKIIPTFLKPPIAAA